MIQHETDSLPRKSNTTGLEPPPEAASQLVDTISLPNRWARIDQALLNNLGSSEAVWSCFDARTPQIAARPVTAGGRAAAWFVHTGGFDAVLRYYRRGGLVAKLVQDRYFWSGLNQTRAFSEFDLLRSMWQSGLPVPRPLGASVFKHGITYRAALLTQRIPEAHPLAHATDLSLWKRAGTVIAEMHRFGVWHADLNVFNVLCDAKGKVWLIDFDRGHKGNLTPSKRTENLSRLLRSLKKTIGDSYQTYWLSLIEGYKQGRLAGEQLK